MSEPMEFDLVDKPYDAKVTPNGNIYTIRLTRNTYPYPRAISDDKDIVIKLDSEVFCALLDCMDIAFDKEVDSESIAIDPASIKPVEVVIRQHSCLLAPGGV